MTRKQVEAHTDGACLGNPGPGGHAALLRYRGKEREVVGGEALTTNNRMELNAVIKALSSLKRNCDVTIHTDSEYVRKCFAEYGLAPLEMPALLARASERPANLAAGPPQDPE